MCISYIVVKFQTPSYNTFRDMIFFLGPVTHRRTESDAYEPTMHKKKKKICLLLSFYLNG